jgi:hypothetical protein
MGYRHQNESISSMLVQIVFGIIGIILGSLFMGAVIATICNYLVPLTGLPLITWKTGLAISWALVIVGSYFKSK